MRAENSKKQDASYDFKERERELNEHLETMTQIAQRIDDENRALMKKNAELKIEYLS
jgi:flagellar motor switch protein FliM